MRMVFAALLLVAACGDAALNSKTQGETCSASSECGAGLLCDFGQSPPVCAGMSSVPVADAPSGVDTPPDVDAPAIDSPPGVDAPAIDAPPIDAAPDAPVDAAPDAAVDAAPDA